MRPRINQVLHIFRKDLRHFWPEALLTVLVTGAFAWVYPAQWLPVTAVPLSLLGVPFTSVSRETLSGIVTALVPISWFIQITRLVQDECLVGERPYWYTRPYEWRKLLAAKALFLALFLVLPLAIAQAVLLHLGGFSVARHLPGLAYLLLLNVGAFVLPLLCLATITRNFLRAALTLIVLCLIVIGLAVLWGDHLDTVALPISDRLSLPLFCVVGILCVVSQYATRKTWLARSLLVAVSVTLVLTTGNPAAGSLVDHYYPSPAASIPVHLALPPAGPGATADHLPAITAGDDTKHLSLHLPLAIADVPYGFWIIPDNLRIRIVAADGSQWTSPWVKTYNHVYRQGTEEGALSFTIDKAFLTRARTHPVKLIVSLSLTQWEAGMPVRYALPATGDLILPGFGRCNTSAAEPNDQAALRCRYPLHTPNRTLLTADVTQQRCPETLTAPLERFQESADAGERSPDPADIGLTSVWDTTLKLAYQNKTDSTASAPAHLCPGATVSLTPYSVVRRAVYTFSQADVPLPR